MRFQFYSDDYEHEVIRGLDKPYKLKLPIQEGYKKSDNKVLVIIQHVSSSDLKLRTLLGDDITRTTYTNVLKYMESYVKSLDKAISPRYAFLNFNDIKSYHLGEELQSTAHRMFVDRVKYHIKQLKPDTILIFGDEAAKALISDEDLHNDVEYYRGWKHKIKKIPTYNTIAIDRAFAPKEGGDELSDDAIVQANLLGYAARCLAKAFLSKSVLKKMTISDNIKYKVIEDMSEFKKFNKKLKAADRFCYDSETTGLDTHKNNILIMQFSFDSELSYILPLLHKDAKWTSKEILYIKKELRKTFAKKQNFFDEDNLKYIIGQNIGFDLRVLRSWLQIPYIYWPVWDTQAGDFLGDENLKGLANFGTPYYNLANMCCWYGNDYYYRADFGKSQRTTIADESLSNKGLLKYSAADTLFPWRIHEVQLWLAKKSKNEKGKSYLSDYLKMLLVQQSQMIKGQSVMKHRGTKVNVEYLTEITKADGPVEHRLRELNAQVYADAKVIEADICIKEEQNLPTVGLFGGSDPIVDLSKRAHQKVLYIDVLKLDPIAYSHKTKEPKFDKHFLNHYKETHEVTGLLQRISQLEKIKSSFITPFMERIENDPDAQVDQRIRPDFGYLPVVTGRSNSSKPSLQQIPEHSEDAKIVKAMFTIPRKSLHYEADYSAHEVRCIDPSMLVVTDQGYRNIQHIIDNPEIPYKALSHSIETGKDEFKNIGYRSSHTTTEDMYEIEYEGGTIRLTANHPVWSVTRGCYVEVKDLTIDDALLPTNTEESVRINQIYKVSNPETVCDIGVEDNHNLYIAADETQTPVLVHNCWGIVSQDAALMNSFRSIHNYLVSYRIKPTIKKRDGLATYADPHRQNFQAFTGVPAGEVTKDQRQQAKGITFGSMYGMSPISLAGQINKEVEETKQIMSRFFKKFHKAKKWLELKVASAHKNLFIQSPIGRKRNLFCMLSGHKSIVAAGERRAQNCITGDHIITTNIGMIAIKDLVGKKFNVMTEHGLWARCNGAESRGIKPTFRVDFSDGSYVEGTADHRVRILGEHFKHEWKPLGELTLEDAVVKYENRHVTYVKPVSSPISTGEQEVFDVIDVQHYHHFIANGVVIHNSEIQGFASDLGFCAGDLFSRYLFECLDKLGYYEDKIDLADNTVIILPTGANAAVHDSIKGEAEFEYYFLHLHLLEWAMTTGVRGFLSDIYGFKTGINFEIEADVSGHSWAYKRTWVGPFSMPKYEIKQYKKGEDLGKASLEFIIKKGLQDHEKLYPGSVKSVDKTYSKMLKCYEKQKKKLKLDKNFPLNTNKEKLVKL